MSALKRIIVKWETGVGYCYYRMVRDLSLLEMQRDFWTFEAGGGAQKRLGGRGPTMVDSNMASFSV
jgi:hypothetical protein